MGELLRPADFRDLATPLTVDVSIGGATQSLALTVQSVTPLPSHRLRAEPFSLILAGPAAPALPQASYSVQHPRLGRVDLFLVPIARNATATQYEATFN
jgi:hypothetical protein